MCELIDLETLFGAATLARSPRRAAVEHRPARPAGYDVDDPEVPAAAAAVRLDVVLTAARPPAPPR